MSTAELHPPYVLKPSSSIPYPQPIESEKTCVASVPPSTHSLFVEDDLEAMFTEWTLDDAGSGESREHGFTTSPPGYVGDPFSLSGLAPLQTFIPHGLFPDDLLVHDPDRIIKGRCDSSSDLPLRYVRIFPNLKASRGPRPYPPYLRLVPGFSDAQDCCLPPEPAYLNRSPADPVHTAHLYLKAANGIAEGHHSSVFAAPLRLRLDPQSGAESTVRVAVKTARTTCGAHTMLNVEANVYDAFPRHLMDDQYVQVPATEAVGRAPLVSSHGAAPPEPLAFWADPPAAPSRLEPFYTGTGVERTTFPATAGAVEPAVVPKFYGYYAVVPLCRHKHCGPDATCPVPQWPTRILLVEECGQPIVSGQAFTLEQKLHCLQLVRRLHAAGFTQNSMHHRNILVQPGPLCAPPAARSYATPSFRIIDFGRGVVRAHLPSVLPSPFGDLCEGEVWRAVYRVLELGRAAEGAEAEAARVEQGKLEAVVCDVYATLISLHSSQLDRQIMDVAAQTVSGW